MASYGEAGALAYEIPERFIQSRQQAGGAAATPQGGIAPQGAYQQPQPNLLAEREQLTDNYYNNYGVLDTYAKDMAKKGINVFEPDYTQPGGGEAFKTFQRMQANVMHGANALKVEMEAEKQMRQNEALGHTRIEPGVDRKGLYYSKPENFYTTAIDPAVLEANKGLNLEFGTSSEAKAANESIREPLLHHLNEMKKKLQSEGKPTTRIDEDIHALTTANRINPMLAAAYARTEATKEGREAKSMLPLYENITNATRGAFDGRDVILKGKHFIFSPIHQGDDYGEIQIPKKDKLDNLNQVTVKRKIKGLLKDNEGVYLQFEDPDIPIQRVDNLPPDEVFRTFVESNSGKYGGANSLPAFYNELAAKGHLQNDRTVSQNTLYGGNETVQKANVRPGTGFEVIKKYTEDEFNKVVNGDLKELVLPTKQGEYKFQASDKKVMLSNWKDLGYKKNPGAITYDDFIDIMDKTGYLQGVLDRHPGLRKGTAAPQQTATPPYDETEWKTLQPGEKRLAPDGTILTKK